MFKSFVRVMAMFAVITATIPAFAGGPGSGGYLEVVPFVNGKALVRSENDYKYHVKPGEVMTFAPRFVGDNGQEVPPPVQPLEWRVNVDSAPGVVSAAGRSGRGRKPSNAWVARKEGFIYVTATAWSGDANKEFFRTALETIVVSNKPAPDFSVELMYQPFADPNTHDGLVIMKYKTNITLTNGHTYAYSYNGKAYCGFTCDQGSTWDELTLDNNVSWTYKSGTTSAYRWWTENGEIKSTATPLPDGIMGYQGIDLPMSIPTTVPGSGFLIQAGVIPGKG